MEGFIPGFIIGFASSILLIIIAIFTARWFIREFRVDDHNKAKIKGKKEPNMEALSNENIYREIQNLSHLPERADQKTMEKWAWERIQTHSLEILKEIEFIYGLRKEEPSLHLIRYPMMLNAISNPIIAAYKQMKGPISKDTINLIIEEHLNEPKSNTDKEYQENPVMQRNKNREQEPGYQNID